MAQRKILPPRVNRGRRPQQSQQQKARDDLIYSQLMERAEMQAKQQQAKKQNQRHKLQQVVNSSLLQLQYKQNMANNRIFFPYSRGYHYFFELSSFPRLQQSESYAIDADNVFGFNYSQQQKVLNKENGVKVGELLNRCYFGLPICPPSADTARTRDKNVCHAYLFPNQDRKFYIDRNLEQLKRILSKFDKLEQTGNIHKFSCLKKDIDLLPIIQDQLTRQQKKSILQRKIKILQQKKESIKNYVILEDKNFFYHSLNQKLHNKIQQKTSELSFKYITSQIQNSDFLRDTLCQILRNGTKNKQSNEKQKNGNEDCQLKNNKQSVQNQDKVEEKNEQNVEKVDYILKRMFSFYPNEDLKMCLSKAMLEKVKEKILENDGLFFRKEIDTGFYEITMPFAFFNFSNNALMSVCEKILALRLAYQNQSSFYMCKIFWKKIFNRDLLINKQMKQLSRADYERTLSSILTQLQKHKKPRSQPQPQPQPPILDTLLNFSCFCPTSSNLDLFPFQKPQYITLRQLTIIHLFHSLYLCLSDQQLYQFIISNEVFSELIANEYFNKGQHYVVECLGSYQSGLIDQVLKRICEWVVRGEVEAECRIKWGWADGVGAVSKVGLEPEWETEKEEDQHEEEEQEVDNNSKRIK